MKLVSRKAHIIYMFEPTLCSLEAHIKNAIAGGKNASDWPSAMRMSFSMSLPGWLPAVIRALIFVKYINQMCVYR